MPGEGGRRLACERVKGRDREIEREKKVRKIKIKKLKIIRETNEQREKEHTLRHKDKRKVRQKK